MTHQPQRCHNSWLMSIPLLTDVGQRKLAVSFAEVFTGRNIP